MLAVDRRDGTILWQKTVREAIPNEGIHYTGSYASSSPVVDGEHLFAFFGSYGLHGDTLIVNWDHEGPSFLVAFDKRTGRERFKVARDEPTSWATPVVVEHRGKHQVIVSGTNRVRGYDLASGRVIWECGGLSANVVASPVAAQGMVYAGSSYDTRNLLAIRLEGAKGDITGTDRVAWTRHRGPPYVPSPLLYEDALYFIYHYQGILTRLHATTGEERPGPVRLRGLANIYASPVGAAGRVYITDLDGATLVITHEDNPGRWHSTFSRTASALPPPSPATSCSCAGSSISTVSRNQIELVTDIHRCSGMVIHARSGWLYQSVGRPLMPQMNFFARRVDEANRDMRSQPFRAGT